MQTGQVSRPRNALNVTDVERALMRELFLRGVRMADIARRTSRCETVVSRAVRGIKRPKPVRHPKARRNRLLLKRVLEDGMSQAAVARRFGVSPSYVCDVVRQALGLRKRRRKRTAVVGTPTIAARPSATARTRKQRARRDARIVELVEHGVTAAAVARRFGLSASTVRSIVARRVKRRG